MNLRTNNDFLLLDFKSFLKGTLWCGAADERWSGLNGKALDLLFPARAYPDPDSRSNPGGAEAG